MASGGLGRGGGNRPRPKRVVRTGLALVHENEVVYPAVGSEAQASVAVDDASNQIHIHFPVIIEVVGSEAPPQEAPQAQGQAALRALEFALRQS
jgi:hypothetical protein